MQVQLQNKLTLLDLASDERFVGILSDYERNKIFTTGNFAHKDRELTKLRKHYHIDTYGRGKDLVLIIGEPNPNAANADGRTTRQTNQIIKDLLQNLEIMNANNKLDFHKNVTSKKWIKDIGNVTFDTYQNITLKVGNHYNSKVGQTKYHDRHVSFIPYDNPFEMEFSEIILETRTLSTIDNEIDKALRRLGNQFRKSAEKIGYKFHLNYQGLTLPIRHEHYDDWKDEVVIETEKPHLITLSVEDQAKYEDFLENTKPKDTDIIEFSKSATYMDFISDNFSLSNLWQTWELYETPNIKTDLIDKDTKNLQKDFVNKMYQSFVTATFGAKMQRTPYKYQRAIRVAEFAYEDDYAKQLLINGNMDEIHSNDKGQFSSTDSVYPNFYYKMIGDMTLAPAFKELTRIVTGIKIDNTKYVKRKHAYVKALLDKAADDKLLEMALQQQNPELFE